MATPARVKIICKTPSTGTTQCSTPVARINSPFPRSVQSSRVAAIPVNDDIAEKRRRRMEAATVTASPTVGTPVKRKDTQGGNQWTNAQIADHYSQCIKLSSENKINAKNAFGLHLIDHMAQMLESKGDETNFQVAGCTLDAGAKIYAGRVDAIYNDVYKMLGGFGRANRQEKEKDSDDEEPGSEPSKAKQGKGKKHHANGFSSQIVKDVASISSDHFDLEFEVDPLFKKMSASFDEGGAAGLLINQLRLDSDHCQLMMDASSRITADVASISSIPINVSSLRKYVMDMSMAKICPTLSGFSLAADANQVEWTTSLLLSSTKKPPQSPSHLTTFDGDPVQLNYSDDDDNGDGFTTGVADSLGHYDVDLSVINDQPTNTGVLNDTCNFPLTGQQPARPPLPELLQSSEYSYFSQAAVEAWAGPQHWKLRPRPKPQDENDEKAAEKTGAKRAPRKAFSLDFSVPVSASLFVKVKITGRKLSKLQIQRITVDHTTLPHNECISEERFQHICGRPDWIVKRHKRRPALEDETDANQLYDYDNAVDQENFCPMVTETGAGGESSDDGNTVGENFSGCPDDTVLPFANNTQQIFNDTCDVSTRLLIGDNLVTAPNKVDQIKIHFARQAKRINMQKLKSSMWSVIVENQSTASDDKENENTVNVRHKGGALFSHICTRLPNLLSHTMAKEVSVPIAFVSLLHLANEKNLAIRNSMDDLEILTCNT